VGGAVVVDWSPGELYYGALVAEQRAIAAAELAEKVRRDLILQAVERYYRLLGAEAGIAVVADDLALTEAYAEMIAGAVDAGTAFRADLLRVKTQASRTRLAVRQAEEARDLAAAALAETLRLAPETALRPAKADLVPVSLMGDKGVATLIAEAMGNRPELRAVDAGATAAALEAERAKVAPLVPSLQAGYAAGGLGGGRAGQVGNFDDQQDFFVGLGWRIGPGGLFDRQSRAIADARQTAALSLTGQVKAAIGREVVDAALRTRSAADQIAINDEAVTAAEEMVKLARERQASQLGVVLEYLLAQEELTRARQSRIDAVTGFNLSQHALKTAVGAPALRGGGADVEYSRTKKRD
jgi:outer membrane protein TolC